MCLLKVNYEFFHSFFQDATKSVNSPRATTAGGKRKSITFEDGARSNSAGGGGAAKRRSSGGGGGNGGSLYAPPTGKYSKGVDQYRELIDSFHIFA